MFAAALPLGALAPTGCATDAATSSLGQRISCSDTGTEITGCHAMDDSAGTGSDDSTCEDVDDDGDGHPHDEGEEHHHHTGSGAAGGHATTDDDDGDGIPNARDCDHRHGGDDDPADHDAGDDAGSDGSGHG